MGHGGPHGLEMTSRTREKSQQKLAGPSLWWDGSSLVCRYSVVVVVMVGVLAGDSGIFSTTMSSVARHM